MTWVQIKGLDDSQRCLLLCCVNLQNIRPRLTSCILQTRATPPFQMSPSNNQKALQGEFNVLCFLWDHSDVIT